MPRNQRSGNATLRSVTCVPPERKLKALRPTDSASPASSRTRASAARIGGLKSTFVVPLPTTSPSYAAGSRSARI